MKGAAPFAFIQPFHSTKPKTKKTFFLICFHFICWFSKWNGSELKSIITVLSYIGWPVLNNKSMKENLFGWNWFIWAVAGYGRPHAISNSFNSFQSSLQNGKIDWIDECCGGCGTKPNSNHWNWLRNCLARSVWWKELNCGLLSLLPAAVMGAAAPRAPPKGRQANPAIQWNPIKQSLSLSAMKRKWAEWKSLIWMKATPAQQQKEEREPPSASALSSISFLRKKEKSNCAAIVGAPQQANSHLSLITQPTKVVVDWWKRWSCCCCAISPQKPNQTNHFTHGVEFVKWSLIVFCLLLNS